MIWDHNDYDNDAQDGIRAQIFETSGSGPGRDFAPSGDEIVVTVGREAGETIPHVAGIGGGGFVALWLENTGETNEFGGRIRAIKAQFFDAVGQTSGEELTVFEGYLGVTVDFDVAENELGALMAVWSEARSVNGGSSVYTVMGRNLNVPVTADEIEGTLGPDTLEGTAGPDHIEGLAGNDVLRGLAGNDSLRGGDGVDILSGGDGDDFIFGGETSADLRDVVYGGAGNDSIHGGYGNDELRGDAGNDSIEGGFGVDTVIGGDGDDVLTGSAWSEEIFGSNGNDFINGGFGHDRVNGGEGADKFYHLGIFDHGSDWIQDYNAAEGDVLMWGGAAATVDDFQINTADTANAGVDGVSESFIIYRTTGQIMWALVDGDAQSAINIQIAGQVFDLIG